MGLFTEVFRDQPRLWLETLLIGGLFLVLWCLYKLLLAPLFSPLRKVIMCICPACLTLYVPPVGARMLVSIIFRFCNLHQMFQPETMIPSSWRVSNGGQPTTRRIPTSSTDRLHGAISSRMTVLQLISVFLLLFCMLFLIFLVMQAASTQIVLGTLCNLSPLEKAKHSILYPCKLPLGLHI